MIHSIENGRFRISVDTRGAELRRFTDLTDGHEYLWEGNPAVWSGTSPLLFPIVGRLRGDTYTLDGTAYRMLIHGFARNAEFALESQNDTELVFLLTDNEETRLQYPFAFALRVRYTLLAEGFVMEFSVENKNDGKMYFSLGAHPAFAIDLGDCVVMDEEETLCAYKLNQDHLLDPVRHPVFDHSRTLTITEQTFADDALIFEGVRSKGASVIRANGRNVHVAFDAPCLGLWAKPGAPYVCIEPWFGADDAHDADGDLTKKPHIVSLEANKTFVFPLHITV